MRHPLLGMAAALTLITSTSYVTAYAAAPNPETDVQSPKLSDLAVNELAKPMQLLDRVAIRSHSMDADADGLVKAIADLNAYLGPGPNGKNWRAFLHLDELEAQVNKGDQAIPRC